MQRRYVSTTHTTHTLLRSNVTWASLPPPEPAPTFTWIHPTDGEIRPGEHYSILYDEYQGGATTTLIIHKSKVSDAGTYTLEATNRNGKEKVELDLIVLDNIPECECDMYRSGNKQCSCTHSYTG